MTLCPCSSGKSYKACCQSLHEGKKAETALELMRSRYSAYVLNLTNYIIETTHPANSQYMKNRALWQKEITEFSKATIFQGLEIHDFEENGKEATVTFTAYLSQNGKDASFTEKSLFEKTERGWLYKGAEFIQKEGL